MTEDEQPRPRMPGLPIRLEPMAPSRQLFVPTMAPARRAIPRVIVLFLAAVAVGLSWAGLWTGRGYWNPVLFTLLWTGAAVLMYSASARGYPGVGHHLTLGLVSLPLWWWFELVNYRVHNWEYIGRE